MMDEEEVACIHPHTYTHWNTAQPLKRMNNATFWRREWQPTLVFLPGESYGQKNLVGYSPWGSQDSDTTDCFHPHGATRDYPTKCSNSESQRQTPYDITYMWNRKYGINEHTHQKETDSQT